MNDLLDAELLALKMLAGHVPMQASTMISICLEELGQRGLCSRNHPPTLTQGGLAVLEEVTGAIYLCARRTVR
ncbi:hypothetical protein J2X76_001646 [Neorhizobium sp. 2083]|uniref:hypothetical protein n=1 Tax=Neorhizobium sp. 2083 TaxID=2817762 RepID=UPI002864CABD|nr:hypothetical protein [Neorhizobium sp. 2083]MDR6816473.1 hypothetical protein [Neorhizobium sp. 2083]